jgi:hypothetical protein
LVLERRGAGDTIKKNPENGNEQIELARNEFIVMNMKNLI